MPLTAVEQKLNALRKRENKSVGFMDMMHIFGDADKLRETVNTDPLSKSLLIEAMATEGVSCAGFGLHMDGVPCN